MPLKLALGTAQFGLDYGVSNVRGRTPPGEVAQILSIARNQGVDLLDTAPLYGSAEQTLGDIGVRQFAIVSKTLQFAGHSSINKDDAASVLRAAETSLARLDMPQLYGLLIHRADDLLLDGADLLVETLLRLKADGITKKIGISAYRRETLNAALSRYPFDIVQVPANVLDQRLTNDGYLASLSSRGIEIHVRSAFLQGLLLMQADELPLHLAHAKPWIQKWHSACTAVAVSPVDAALAFLATVPGITRVIVGAVDAQQFSQLLASYHRLAANQPRLDWATFACADATIVDPSQWPLT